MASPQYFQVQYQSDSKSVHLTEIIRLKCLLPAIYLEIQTKQNNNC